MAAAAAEVRPVEGLEGVDFWEMVVTERVGYIVVEVAPVEMELTVPIQIVEAMVVKIQ